MTPRETFATKAPWLMQRLLDADFGFVVDDTAVIAGNAGHESNGFTAMQEIKPRAGRGGFGWFQWTGPRRRAFEAFCARERLDPSSDEANIAFLIVELRGPERKAVGAVKAAEGLYNKTVAFERSFERAGVKHYESRLEWAALALSAYRRAQEAKPPEQPPVPSPSTPPAIPPRTLAGGLVALIAAVAALVYHWITKGT